MTEKFITEILGTPKGSQPRQNLSSRLVAILKNRFKELNPDLQKDFIKTLIDKANPKPIGIKKLFTRSPLNPKVHNLFMSLYNKNEEEYTKLLDDKRTKLGKETIHAHYDTLFQRNKRRFRNKSESEIKEKTYEEFFKLLNSHIIISTNTLNRIIREAVCFKIKNDNLLKFILELYLNFRIRFYVEEQESFISLRRDDSLELYVSHIMVATYCNDNYIVYKKLIEFENVLNNGNIPTDKIIRFMKELVEQYNLNLAGIFWNALKKAEQGEEGAHISALDALKQEVKKAVEEAFSQAALNSREIYVRKFIEENKISFLAKLTTRYGA